MTNRELILASASPRRRELLEAMGLVFDVEPSRVDESLIVADHPRTFALRAAFAKGRDVADRLEQGRWAIAADTVVAHGMILFGKPSTAEEARAALRSLSGKTHRVITGIALAAGGSATCHLVAEETSVTFRELTMAEIDAYIATGEPFDKAGGYGIQGAGGDLVSRIEGDYFNVVGLPCRALAGLMEEAGLEGPKSLPEPPERWAVR